MIMQCIAALAVLAVVITGLLVTVQAISLERALRATGRILAAVVLAITTLCLLRDLFRSVVFPFLSLLLPTLAHIAAILFAILVLGVVTKFVAMRVMNRDARSSRRSEP